MGEADVHVVEGAGEDQDSQDEGDVDVEEDEVFVSDEQSDSEL